MRKTIFNILKCGLTLIFVANFMLHVSPKKKKCNNGLISKII